METHKGTKSGMILPRWGSLPDIELYMDQVIILLDKYLGPFMKREGEKLITASMVNNYVKQGLVPAPVKKRYQRPHLAHLIMVVGFKQIFSMEEIQALLNAEMQQKDIETVYDGFCQAQEEAFDRILRGLAGEKLSESSAMDLAVLANAGKILAVRNLDKNG